MTKSPPKTMTLAIRTTGWVTLGVVAVVVVACALDGDPFLAIPISLSLVLVAAIVFLVFYQKQRSDRRDLIKLFAGDAWVRWTFDPETWLSYAQAALQAETARVRANRKGMILVGLVTGLSAVLAFLGTGGAGAIASAGVLFGIMALLLGTRWFGPMIVYRRTLASPPEVLIGSQGIYQRGKYISFSDDVYLRGARFQPGDWPEFILSLAVRGKTYNKFEVRVPVPKGHEQEAHELVARFCKWQGWQMRGRAAL
jgi:hypothetical protein